MTEITKNIEGTVMTLQVSGRIDAATAPELRKVSDMMPEDITRLVIDMSGTEYISSAGIRVLLIMQKKMDSRGGTLTLHGLSNTTSRIIVATGLAEVFNME